MITRNDKWESCTLECCLCVWIIVGLHILISVDMHGWLDSVYAYISAYFVPCRPIRLLFSYILRSTFDNITQGNPRGNWRFSAKLVNNTDGNSAVGCCDWLIYRNEPLRLDWPYSPKASRLTHEMLQINPPSDPKSFTPRNAKLLKPIPGKQNIHFETK